MDEFLIKCTCNDNYSSSKSHHLTLHIKCINYMAKTPYFITGLTLALKILHPSMYLVESFNLTCTV